MHIYANKPCISKHMTMVNYFINLSLKLLETTETELIAIAAPAIIGLSRNPLKEYNKPAAIGIPIILYIKAQKRFCLIVCTVLFDNLIA